MTTQKTFRPGEVKIVHFFRFEGESNPDDNSILYSIETNDGGRGTLKDAYRIYSDSQVTNFMQQVEVINK